MAEEVVKKEEAGLAVSDRGASPLKNIKPKQVIGIIAGIAVAVIVWFLPIKMEPLAQGQLALTLMALIWWALSVLPAPITAAIYMGGLIVLGIGNPADVFGAWYRGCNTWIVIAAMLIAAGAESTGLGRRIAYAIASLSFIKGWKSLIIAITIMEIVLALIIPSAFARTFLILVIVREICVANDVNERDSLVLGFASFALCVPTTMIFLTGEAAINTIVANFIGEISWVQWFVWAGIPNIVFIFIVAVVFMFVFRPTGAVAIDTTVCRDKLHELGKLSYMEIKMICWLVVLFIFWMFAGRLGISLNCGTMFICFLMFLPVIGCLTPRALGSISAGTLIFVTCTVAVGSVGAATGMNAWIANTLLPETFTTNIIAIVLFVALLSMIVHMVVGSVMASTTVLMPILLAFCSVLGDGVSSTVVLLCGYQVIAGHYLLALHQAPLATGMDKGGYSDREVLRMSIPMTIVIFIQVLIDLGWFSIIGLV